MLKIKREKERIIGIFIALGFAVLLGCLYLYNVKNINTIWEMGDEGGYLFNASLFSPYDWKETFSNARHYYGYGYSFLLIPLFYMCSTGVSLIRGCIIVNIICLLGIYFIQIYIMSKLWKKRSICILSMISFIVCLYPYLASNVMMVVCEVFLSFFVWVITLLFYKAISEKNYIFWFLLGFAVAFVFFIHTRAVVVLVTINLFIALLIFLKRVDLKKIILYGLSFLCFFVVLYFAKHYFLGVLGTGKIALSRGTTEVTNIMTTKWVVDRIRWVFAKRNIVKYILCAVSKIFYLIASTAGVLLLGIVYGISELRCRIRDIPNKYDETHIVKAFFIFLFLLMFIACCVSGTGSTYAYMIYGRYYEYCISPIIIMGMLYLTDKPQKSPKLHFIALVMIVCSGILSLNLSAFANSEQIGIDINRIPSISYAIAQNENYLNTIYFLILFTVLTNIVYFCVAKYKCKVIIIPLTVLVIFGINDIEAIREINEVNRTCITDINISNYIEENKDDQSIYFVYEPYRYNSFYMRMQVFIKNNAMHIVLPEEVESIEEESFVITYINSEKAAEFAEVEEYEYIMKSAHYNLYIKR